MIESEKKRFDKLNHRNQKILKYKGKLKETVGVYLRAVRRDFGGGS